MAEVEVTWERALKIWWSVTWRLGLLYEAGNFLVYGVVRLAGDTWNIAYDDLAFIVILLVPAWIGVAGWDVLRRDFSDFRIALVAIDRTP